MAFVGSTVCVGSIWHGRQRRRTLGVGMCLHPKELDPKEPRQAKTERGHAQTPSAKSPSLLLCCCSVLGRHSAPSTSLCCAAQRVRLRGLSPRPMPAGVVAPSETHLRIRAARPGGRSLGTRQPKTRCCSCRTFTKHTGRQRTCF